jgi:hypothetical protein
MLALVIAAVDIRYACADENSPSTPGGKYGLEADIEAQYKPAALEVSTGAWYRYIYHGDVSPLWDGLYVKGGGLVSLNPAYGQLSAYLEWLPIAILQLRAQVDRYEFFGSNGSLLIYSDPKGAFGYGDHGARDGQEIPGQADRLLLQPTLQGEFGRYIAVNQASYAFYRFSRDGPYFWDQEYDTLLKKQDQLYADDLSLLYNFAAEGSREKLLLGPSWEVVHASGADLTRTRLGLNFYFEPAPGKSIFGYLQHPRYYFQMGVNTQDRNQQGQIYFVGGIGADFDLN